MAKKNENVVFEAVESETEERPRRGRPRKASATRGSVSLTLNDEEWAMLDGLLVKYQMALTAQGLDPTILTPAMVIKAAIRQVASLQ